jgi:hypothetical protein
MPLTDLPGAIGPTANGLPATVNSERTTNLIAEKVESNGKVAFYYKRVAGYSSVAATTAATGGVQGGLYINGRRFVIAGDQLWEITGGAIPFSSTLIGSVGPALGQYVRYSIATNIRGNQLCIASNNVTSVYDLTTNTFTASVTTPEPLIMVDEVDGYFIGLASSGNFYISAFQNGTSWNPLDFAFEETPDLTMGFKVCNRRVWMFGSQHIEVFVDSGDPNFPFTRDQSVYVEAGAYRNSLCIADNTVYGIATDARGAGWAFFLNGAQPQRFSTHAVETAWGRYATIRDVVPKVYQEAGHAVVVFSFPTANVSWGYDITTGIWHERGVYNSATGNWDRDWGEVHFFDPVLQVHFVGDYRNGNMYLQGQQYYDFAGTPIYWRRRFPHINDDQTGIVYDLVRVIMQTGVQGSLPAGTPATVTLAKSDDGGYTFTTPTYPVSIGAAGAFNKRLDWNAMGYSTDRVFELIGNDPIPLAILAVKGSVRSCAN